MSHFTYHIHLQPSLFVCSRLYFYIFQLQFKVDLTLTSLSTRFQSPLFLYITTYPYIRHYIQIHILYYTYTRLGCIYISCISLCLCLSPPLLFSRSFIFLYLIHSFSFSLLYYRDTDRFWEYRDIIFSFQQRYCENCEKNTFFCPALVLFLGENLCQRIKATFCQYFVWFVILFTCLIEVVEDQQN